jgi:hypothetical protein
MSGDVGGVGRRVFLIDSGRTPHPGPERLSLVRNDFHQNDKSGPDKELCVGQAGRSAEPRRTGRNANGMTA